MIIIIKHWKGWKKIVAIDEILRFVIEIKIIFGEDRYNIDSFVDLRKDYPDKIEKLVETLLNYIGEDDLNILKTDFPDKKWKYSNKKLAYPYEYFNSLDVYQSSVEN